MNILICGYGYLGKAIAERAVDHHRVSALSLHGTENTISCDVSDEKSVQTLRDKILTPDAIIHCASSGKGGAEAYEKVYRDGLSHLQKTFPDAFLLFTSSTSVYAQEDGSRVNENSETFPTRDTGKILLEAEAIVLQNHGTVCRLAGIYGPQRSVILKKFLQEEAIIEDDGRRYLNQIHRDDAATAILHLLENKLTGIYNVCDSTPLTQLECYTALAKKFRRPLPPHGARDLNRKRGWTHKKVSNEKLRATSWQPRFPSFLDAVEHL